MRLGLLMRRMALDWTDFLQIISLVLFSGDEGYYSCCSEACQDHKKLNSSTHPFQVPLSNPRTLFFFFFFFLVGYVEERPW